MERDFVDLCDFMFFNTILFLVVTRALLRSFFCADGLA